MCSRLVLCAAFASAIALAQSGWVPRVPPSSPGAGGGYSLAYDSARSRAVLLADASFFSASGTWEWDGTSWSQMAGPGPAPRSSHAMAYHPGVGLSVLFAGGTAGLGPLADTWTWDGSTWVPLTTAPSPPPRQALTLAYDAPRGQILTFGWGLPPFSGCGPCFFSNDTWHLELQPVAGPGQANSASALLDVGGSCWAAGSAGGPFAATLPSGGSGALGFRGAPGMPLLLFAGPQNTNTTAAPCLGIPSIGTPPLYTDVAVLFDGLQNPTFTLDFSGRLRIPFTVPVLPPGPFANLQALILQPPGSPCPGTLTAAFYVAIQ